MIARLRWPLLLATAVGLGGVLWALGRVGLAEVLRAVGRVGVPGFLALCLLSLATFLPLGGSWLAAAPGEPLRRLGRFAWGRATRDAANDLLPFSQLGAIVVGVRTLAAAGVAPVTVYAATIVDMSTEMAAQIVFTLFALWSFADLPASGTGRLQPLLWAGTAIATALALSFLLLQRPALRVAGVAARRIVPGAGVLADEVAAALAAVYACRGRTILSFLLNLAAWAATAAWSWAALRLMGSDAGPWHAAALESAIFALRSAAFLVPAAVGVQEAGYALLAPLVGIDPAAALALSLLKRARDLAIGVPTLLLWQAGEARSAIGPTRAS